MKKYILFIIMIITFRILLDWIYEYEISTLFEYANYTNNSTKESLISSWGYLLLFIPFVLWIVDDSSSIFSQLIATYILFLRVIPFTSTMRFLPEQLGFISINFVYWILLFILLKKIKVPSISIRRRNNEGSILAIYIIAAISVLTIVYISGVYCHFRIHLSLDDVYELRLDAREFNIPLFLKYLQAGGSIVIPILMIFFITQKKKSIVYLLAFVGLLNFSIAGHKTTLFNVILCLGLFYFPKLDIKKILPYAFVVLCLSTVFEFIFFNTYFLSATIIRRGFFVPSMLDISYYEYIIHHGPQYFTGGIGMEIGRLSGEEGKRCNNGLFSDAFMNLGYIGCFVFPIIITYFIKIADALTKNLEDSIKIFSAFLIVSTLSGSYFTTSLLTHGLFLMYLVLFFIPPKSIKCKAKMNKKIINYPLV